MVDKPTHEQLLGEDGVKSVLREADDSWRHVSYIYQVFYREADDTYWSASYCLSSDGETYGLRDGREVDIDQVRPIEKTVTSYVPVETTAS